MIEMHSIFDKDPKVIAQTLSSDYAIYQGDCVEVLSGIPSDSIHMSVMSPPFSENVTQWVRIVTSSLVACRTVGVIMK